MKRFTMPFVLVQDIVNYLGSKPAAETIDLINRIRSNECFISEDNLPSAPTDEPVAEVADAGEPN